jgi:hypothetical protein
MKLRLTCTILLVLGALATNGCPKIQTDTAQLEELPKEIAAHLQHVPNSDLLVAMPPVAMKTPAVTNLEAPALSISPLEPPCESTEKFLIQVLYPVTVCSPRRDLGEVLTTYDTAMSPGPRPSTNVKSYQLSLFEGHPLTNVIFCYQRNGPWLASIINTLNCHNQGTCTMAIEGVPACPNCPFFLWHGQNCHIPSDLVVDRGASTVRGACPVIFRVHPLPSYATCQKIISTISVS